MTDERTERRIFQDWPFHREAVDRIRSIEHDERQARLRRRFHRVRHRRDVSIDARADVLQIEDHHVHRIHHAALDLLALVLRVKRPHVFVNVRHHVCRRFVRLTVKAEHWQLEMFVKIKRDELARLRVAANAVLGAVKCDELRVRTRAKFFDDGIQPTVEAGRIRDESHMFAANQVEAFFEQDFNAEFHRRMGLFCVHGGAAREQRREAE